MSFGGDRAALDPDDAHRLAFAANFAIRRFVQLHAVGDRCPMPLTPREWECLLWSSDGKTEEDIARILNVSKSTISKHVAAAREKLGAINKFHGMAIAII